MWRVERDGHGSVRSQSCSRDDVEDHARVVCSHCDDVKGSAHGELLARRLGLLAGNWGDSVPLFLAKLLKCGSGAQRVPKRIEPEKGRSNRPVVKPANIWCL